MREHKKFYRLTFSDGKHNKPVTKMFENREDAFNYYEKIIDIDTFVEITEVDSYEFTIFKNGNFIYPDKSET